MVVNSKKSITLKNRTTHFNPDTTKTKVSFSSPNTYQNRQIKIEGYETRLYWQFRYCDEHDGQTFFYTLTYNDAHLPHYYKFSCFDYEDLRDLLTGGFYQNLLRNYGTKFKYFVSAELGDGKGERGMHNNPHYHVLFFLENANDRRYPYKKITSLEFRHLVRRYWQGFDEDTDGYHDYKEAKYGIAREGEENLGKVVDFRAVEYCAKYVCKDVKLKQNEQKLSNVVRFLTKRYYKFSEASYKKFLYEYIYPHYNIPMDSKHTKWLYDDEQLCNLINPSILTIKGTNIKCDFNYYFVRDLINTEKLWNEYYDMVSEYVDEKVKDAIRIWRNRYCNKCRISNGVGDYALEFIKDKLNPVIQVPSETGFKNRPVSMYYYRKLFMDYNKDSNGSVIYTLNTDGMLYKMNKLPKQIEKLVEVTKNNVYNVIKNPILYDKMRESDINIENFLSYEEFLKKYNYLLNENKIEEIYKKYAEYKLVYEHRFFRFNIDRDSNTFNFPDIDVYGDYSRFLVPSFYSVSRNPLMLDTFLESTPENYMPYSQHPYFLQYLRFFSMFDMCSDYFFIQEDNRRQKEAEEIAAVKRFHNIAKIKQFYKSFSNC